MHTSAGRGRHRWAGPTPSPASKHAANGAEPPVGRAGTPAAHPGPPGRSPGRRQAMVGPPRRSRVGCSAPPDFVPVPVPAWWGLACLPTLDPPAPLGPVWAVGSAGWERSAAGRPIGRILPTSLPIGRICRPACSDQPNLPTSQPDRLLCSKTIQGGQHSTAWPSQHGAGSLSADQPSAASYASQPMACRSTACQLRTSPGPNTLEHTRPHPPQMAGTGPKLRTGGCRMTDQWGALECPPPAVASHLPCRQRPTNSPPSTHPRLPCTLASHPLQAHPPRPSRRCPPSRHRRRRRRRQPLPSSPVFCFPALPTTCCDSTVSWLECNKSNQLRLCELSEGKGSEWSRRVCREGLAS